MTSRKGGSLHRDDQLSLRAAFAQTTERFGRLAQGVELVDDGHDGAALEVVALIARNPIFLPVNSETSDPRNRTPKSSFMDPPTLALTPGERVGLILVRHPDPRRWNLEKLAKSGAGEDRVLAEQGLAEWADALDEEDHH